MTNEEALAHFKNHEYMTDFSWQDEMSEVAIVAIEKQIPKKPEYAYKEYMPEVDWVCGSCGKKYNRTNLNVVRFCSYCGQKIDWKE